MTAAREALRRAHHQDAGVASTAAGPGSDSSEGLAAGVGPDALDSRVAPACPPGPASVSRSARSSSSARNTTSDSRLRQRNDSSGVAPAVPAAIEPVPDVVSAGGVDGCGAGVDGEVRLGREAPHVSDLTEDYGCRHGAQAADPVDGAGVILQHGGDVLAGGLELAVQGLDVDDGLQHELLAGLADTVPWATGASSSPALVAVRRRATPLGRRSCSCWCSRLIGAMRCSGRHHGRLVHRCPARTFSCRPSTSAVLLRLCGSTPITTATTCCLLFV